MFKVKKVILLVLMLVFGFLLTTSQVSAGEEVKGIHAAALAGDLVKVKAFLKKAPNLLNEDGRNKKKPIHWAAQGGHKAVVEFLIARGAHVDSKNVADETPLHYAAAFGHKELVEFLLAKGASLTAKTTYKGTAITCAAEEGRLEVIELLIKKGADVKETMENGSTLLHFSAWRGSEEVIEFFIKKNIPVDGKTDFGRTPLQNAVLGNNLEGAAVLIRAGADVNHKGEEDWAPLYLAAKRGYKDMVALLLEANASVDIKREKSRRTPLHLAALNGFGKIAAMLLDKGADPMAEDVKGKTPLDYAAQYGHKKVAKILLAKGVKVEDAKMETLKKRFGFSPLLQKEFKPGSAVVWYLGHSGWAIKTGTHLLIFDYYKREPLPDTPLIANGSINPAEIKDLKVTVFVSHAHGDHYIPAIFDWKKDVKDITYIMGFKPEKQDGYIYMGPREEKKINGVEIVTIESNDSGVGFFVRADGVSIFHSGDHANRKRDFSGPFKKEIQFLADRGLVPDIFYAPVSGCGFGDLESVKKGVYYTIKKLSPKVVFPMHSGGNADRYAEFAKEAQKAGIKTPIYYAGQSGDWFYVNRGTVKKVSACDKGKDSHKDKNKAGVKTKTAKKGCNL